MSRALASAILALVCLTSAAPGQSVKMPDKVDATKGRLTTLVIDWEGDDFQYIVTGKEIDAFREYDPDHKKVRLRILPYADGHYELIAAAVKDKKMTPFAKCVISVGKAPDPGPTPPPPPPHDDPLVKAMRSAYSACTETDKADRAAKMATLYKKAVGALDDAKIKTAGDLYGVLASMHKTLGLSGTMQPVQKVIQAELKKVLPPVPDGADEPYGDPPRVKALFESIAAALTEATR